MDQEVADTVEELRGKWLIDTSEVTFTKVLGRGASGITYMGTYRGSDVAIKVYSQGILKHDARSVKTEMDIMANISHPNIVKFVGLCMYGDPLMPALITQYAPKGELGHALHTAKALRWKGDAVKFKIAIGMAKGLQHLHSQDIVHRDIKPANILLNEDFSPMLTDFGFSRLIDPAGNMTGETGSYRYMAPEIVRRAKYSASADIYSYSLIINELFTDEKPFEYQIPIEAAVGVVKRDLRPSQKRIRNQRLRSIIARGWDGNPNARPQWPEIIAELEAARDEMCPQRSASTSTASASTDAASQPKSPGISDLFRKGRSADRTGAGGLRNLADSLSGSIQSVRGRRGRDETAPPTPSSTAAPTPNPSQHSKAAQ